MNRGGGAIRSGSATQSGEEEFSLEEGDAEVQADTPFPGDALRPVVEEYRAHPHTLSSIFCVPLPPA